MGYKDKKLECNYPPEEEKDKGVTPRTSTDNPGGVSVTYFLNSELGLVSYKEGTGVEPKNASGGRWAVTWLPSPTPGQLPALSRGYEARRS